MDDLLRRRKGARSRTGGASFPRLERCAREPVSLSGYRPRNGLDNGSCAMKGTASALLAGALSLALVACATDYDDNPPGPRGGPGTNWENPPGPVGGPGAITMGATITCIPAIIAGICPTATTTRPAPLEDQARIGKIPPARPAAPARRRTVTCALARRAGAV